MGIFKTGVAGLLFLALGGCEAKPFEKRPYEVTHFTSEYPRGHTIRKGTIYTARNPTGFTEYTDISDDGRLDIKEVRRYRANEPRWLPFSEVGLPVSERVELVEDEETRQDRDRNRVAFGMVIAGAPFDEGQMQNDVDLYTDRLTRFLVRYAPDGQKLQDEFDDVRKKIK